MRGGGAWVEGCVEAKREAVRVCVLVGEVVSGKRAGGRRAMVSATAASAAAA